MINRGGYLILYAVCFTRFSEGVFRVLARSLFAFGEWLWKNARLGTFRDLQEGDQVFIEREEDVDWSGFPEDGSFRAVELRSRSVGRRSWKAQNYQGPGHGGCLIVAP